MAYDITKIFTLGSVQCSLITALLYMIPLKKREKFLLRFLGCAVICLLAAPLLRMYQTITTALFLNSSSTISRLFRTLFGVGGDLTLNLLLIGTVVVICCQLSWQKSLYCSVCAYLTQDIAYTIFVLILPSAANRGARPIQADTLWVELLMMILVYGSFFFLFARVLPKGGDYRFPCVRSLPAMLTIIYIGRMLGAYAKMSFDTQGNQIFSFMLVYDVLLSVTLLVTQLLLKRSAEYRTAAAMEEQLRLTQKQQYEAFRENLDAINHKCHDLKHLVAALKSETDSQRKGELLQELEQEVMIYDAHMHTGNDVLDALLAEAWMNCHHKKVQWTCMADGSAVSFLDPIDLYTMLGNALDNAIESAAKISDTQKRLISVNIWKKERMAFLKIENYCETMPVFQNGLPLTTKKNASEHGYGMRSIRDVVKRYGGEWSVQADDQIFMVNIMLPIPMKVECAETLSDKKYL